jgi:GMP synthase (glutamine-hydrolysing)
MECGDITLEKANKTLGFGPMFMEAGAFSENEAIVIDMVNQPQNLDPLHFPYMGLIVTGSIEMVSAPRPWAVKVLSFLETTFRLGIPTLGICWGHHAIAQVAGGRAGYHPKGMELGSHEIILEPEAQNHPMLYGLPQKFPAYESHSQTVIDLPPGAKILGRSQHDPHQILSYGSLTLTCQFHPEFTAPFMEDLLADMEDYQPSPDVPPGVVLGTVPNETNPSKTLIRRFFELCFQNQLGPPHYRFAPNYIRSRS